MEFLPALVLCIVFIAGSHASLNITLCDGQDAELSERLNEARIEGFQLLFEKQADSMDEMEELDDEDLGSLLTLQLLNPAFLSQLPHQHRNKLRILLEHKALTTLAQAAHDDDDDERLPYINPVKYSQLLLAMEAGCINTRHFFGKDLQYHLTKLTQTFPDPNYRDLFQFAFSMLPLCTTNSMIYNKVWIKLLEVNDMNSPCTVVPREGFTGSKEQHQKHTIATLSLLILTMSCAQHQVPGRHQENFDNVLNLRSQCLANYQNRSSGEFGGSILTTALAVQAMFAANVSQSHWNCTAAVRRLIRPSMSGRRENGTGMMRGNGTFGMRENGTLGMRENGTSGMRENGIFGRDDVEMVLHILPALVGRHIGGLWEANVSCPDGRVRQHTTDDITLLDRTVEFTLFVYNNLTMERSMYNLTIIEGESLHDALTRANLDSDIDFNFTAIELTFFGEETIFISEVNGVANDLETFYHWVVEKMEEKDGRSDDRDDDGDKEEGEEEEEDFEIHGLDEFEPENGDRYHLVYVDLSRWRDLIDRGLGRQENPGTGQGKPGGGQGNPGGGQGNPGEGQGNPGRGQGNPGQ